MVGTILVHNSMPQHLSLFPAVYADDLAVLN